MIWNSKLHVVTRSSVAAVLVLLVTLLTRSAPAAAQDTEIDLERIERATVFIMQATTTGSNVIITCVGSGTLVSRAADRGYRVSSASIIVLRRARQFVVLHSPA